MRAFAMKFALLLAIVAVPVTAAVAHTCANMAELPERQFRDFLEKQNSIFLGKVIGLEVAQANTQTVRIQVLRSWKGAEDSELSLSYTGAYGSFETEMGGIGTERVFYASSSNDGRLTISFCGMQGYRTVDRMKTVLGEATAKQSPRLPPQETGQSFWTMLWHAITYPFTG